MVRFETCSGPNCPAAAFRPWNTQYLAITIKDLIRKNNQSIRSTPLGILRIDCFLLLFPILRNTRNRLLRLLTGVI